MTSGLTGILNASFELAARLKNAGWIVTLAAPVDVAEKVRRQGFNYLQLPFLYEDPSPPISAPKNAGRLAKMRIKFLHYKSRQAEALERLKTQEFNAILNSVKPDLVIIDVELHEFIMVAFIKEVPLILLSQWFSLWKRRGLPPLVRDTVPGKGLNGHWFSIEMDWTRIKWQRRWRFFKKALLSMGTDRRSTLKRYARQYGFPLSLAKQNYWPGPITYTGLPVMAMVVENLEFPHNRQPNVHYVGPMVYQDRKEFNKRLNDAPDIQQLLHLKEQGSKLIYCSVSTMKAGDQQFLKRLVDAVRDRKDWIVILGLGGKLETDFLGPIPENVQAFAWVPQLEVLRIADCSINHGGIHTINECIHFRVPMLVYSGKKSDQNGCAARVAYHQIGIMADKDKDRVEDIRKRIEQLLSDPIYAKQIEKINQIYLTDRANGTFESKVEELYTKQLKKGEVSSH